jgi:hypothetical protein
MLKRPRPPVLLAIGALIAMLTGCDDGTPIVLSETRATSPDGQLDAVIEHLDNGLGFGQGALYFEVHVLRHAARPSNHGARDNSVPYYVEDSTGQDAPPRVMWKDNGNLCIFSQSGNTAPKKWTSVGLVLIHYDCDSRRSDVSGAKGAVVARMNYGLGGPRYTGLTA